MIPPSQPFCSPRHQLGSFSYFLFAFFLTFAASYVFFFPLKVFLHAAHYPTCSHFKKSIPVIYILQIFFVLGHYCTYSFPPITVHAIIFLLSFICFCLSFFIFSLNSLFVAFPYTIHIHSLCLFFPTPFKVWGREGGGQIFSTDFLPCWKIVTCR